MCVVSGGVCGGGRGGGMCGGGGGGGVCGADVWW